MPAPALSIDIVQPEEGDSLDAVLTSDVSRAVDDILPALAQCVALRPGLAVTLVLSTDDEVRQLNHRWRGLDKPTNVLSFSSPRLPDPGGLEGFFLGDIILAGETVVREAAEIGCPVGHHLRHLILHGLLHLLGYDHENEVDAAEMEGLETRILGLVGIPDPYADRAMLSPNQRIDQ